MTISGTRGLIRVSKNPECMLQAAMAVEDVRELEFYREITGRDYREEGHEYGEREAARRRGVKFEANLRQNNAALLRKAVAPLVDADPETMTVRNFADEVPGPPTTMRANRLGRTRALLRDVAGGRADYDLLIEPQLQLPICAGISLFIAPDFMVLDRRAALYVPGELKSFIVRENVAEPGDLDLTRRQAAVQILALRAELGVAKIDRRIDPRAAFVFSTAFGLAPAPAFIEFLDAEVHEVEKVSAGTQKRRNLSGTPGQRRDA